jgi:hypothetical protein
MDGFALAEIAKRLGQVEAVTLLRQATAKEEAGDFDDAMRLYRQAYRIWPELDSGDDRGLPRAVRSEAEAAGIDCDALSAASLETGASPRFDVCATEEWLAYLEEHGYCVIADVADRKSVLQAKSLLWDFLESIPGTQVTRTDVATWGIDGDWLPSSDNGLLGGSGVGQSAFCWHTRLLPLVRRAFASIWCCDDLIVSFDGGNVFRPWLQTPEWRTQGSWWHIDQNAFLPGKDGRKCIQGFVTFTDATPETGGLCVAPGSHHQHEEVCERAYAQKLKGDFVPVQSDDPALAASGARLVCAMAGDLVLWDSRCVHCNAPGVMKTGTGASCGASASAAGAQAELLRVVSYVCMTPAARASSDVLAKRKDAFINNVGTSHSPHEYLGAVEAPPWLPLNRWIDTPELQRRLIVGADSPLLAADHVQ